MAIDWEALLSAVADGKVVPVVGRDLLEVDGDQTYDQLIAAELGIALDLPPEQLRDRPSLEQVAARILEIDRSKAGRIYSEVQRIVETVKPPPPTALRDLVAIDRLRFFVSTTLDDLLVRAIEKERKGVRIIRQWYAPQGEIVAGGPALDDDRAVVVYQLFGRPEPLGKAVLPGDFAVTEEDRLEFIHGLQVKIASNHQEVRGLAAVLRGRDPDRERDLLLLGCGFPDWLMRFVLRTLRGERFGANPESTARIAERDADKPLVFFLQQYGVRVDTRKPSEFVRELAASWVARHEGRRERVMLAHAPEDRPYVDRVTGFLESWGIGQTITSWETADVSSVRQQLGGCALYTGLLSAAALRRGEPRLVAEWTAVERAVSREGADLGVVMATLDDEALAAQRSNQKWPAWSKLRWKPHRPTAEELACGIAEQLWRAKKLQRLAPMDVYCVHADADEPALVELRKQWSFRWATLSDRGNMLDGTVADDWVAQRMEQARVILLLVSADLGQERRAEIDRAVALHEERKALVVPIIVRDFDWRTDLGGMDPLPRDGAPLGLDPRAWYAAMVDLRVRMLDHVLGALRAA